MTLDMVIGFFLGIIVSAFGYWCYTSYDNYLYEKTKRHFDGDYRPGLSPDEALDQKPIWRRQKPPKCNHEFINGVCWRCGEHV